MNAATLRHLQEQMRREGIKPAGDQEVEDEAEDPAVTGPSSHSQQPQKIDLPSNQATTNNTNTSTNSAGSQGEDGDDGSDYELFLRQQHERYQQAVQAGTQCNGDELLLLAPGEGGVIDDDDDASLWNCQSCGYNSPMHLNFCGVCGHARPEDWWCQACDYPNSPLHRFCGNCGTGRMNDDEEVQDQQQQESFGYEDMGLPQQEVDDEQSYQTEEDEEEAIRAAAARMSQHHHIVVPNAPYGAADEDEISSFADDSCDAHPQVAPDAATSVPAADVAGSGEFHGWSCAFCTFQNENPDFLSCEMCGSARPPTPPGSPIPAGGSLSAPQPSRSGDDVEETGRRGSNVEVKSGGSKVGEKRLTEILRLQQIQYQQQATSSSQSQQQQQQGGGNGASSNEPDLELAMIYAQQERILAEYQRQQQMQQR